MIICDCGTEHRLLGTAAKCWKCGKLVSQQPRGLGDTIHSITSALHIFHCGGCEERREWLNKIVPYKQ